MSQRRVAQVTRRWTIGDYALLAGLLATVLIAVLTLRCWFL